MDPWKPGTFLLFALLIAATGCARRDGPPRGAAPPAQVRQEDEKPDPRLETVNDPNSPDHVSQFLAEVFLNDSDDPEDQPASNLAPPLLKIPELPPLPKRYCPAERR